MSRPPSLPPADFTLLALVLAACSGGGGPTGGDITPDVPGQVRVQALATGEGTVTLPFSDPSQEYTLVIESSFPSTLGNAIRVSGAGEAALRALEPATAPAGMADDAPIRRMERELLARLPRGLAMPSSRGLTVADENEESFWVVNSAGSINIVNPSSFDEVNGIRRFQGAHVEIYVDERDNARVTNAQVNAIGAEFDNKTYGVDTGAFGDPSDIDHNGRIVILLTRTVNAMTTQEIKDQGARIVGFFFGIDLRPDPIFNPFANGREIFYAVVPNELEDLPGAKVTEAEYVSLMGGTFAHEFQHMINYNQHVLMRGGALEETWLDEGLAHMAETLNGYPTQNRLRSAFFLDSPSEVALVGDGDGLDERGASWLFVHYMVERFGQSVLGKLVKTNQISTSNVSTATGRTFASLFHEWANMLLLDGGGVPHESIFEMTALDLRSEFQAAKTTLGNDRIPGTYLDLQPVSSGSGALFFNQKGTSPLYVLVTSNAVGNVPILISGAATAGLQVSIVRTR